MEMRNYLPGFPWEQQRNVILTPEDVKIKEDYMKLPDYERKVKLLKEVQSYRRVLNSLEENATLPLENKINVKVIAKTPDESKVETKSPLLETVISIASFFNEKYTYQTILEEIHHCCGDVVAAINKLSTSGYTPCHYNVLDFTNLQGPKDQIKKYISGEMN